MNAEEAKTIHASESWSIICRELDAWILNQMTLMRTCEPEQLKKIQARISAYEEVKNLPQIVMDREE